MFKLSISGRVMVARTYIISQATYLMGIIPLPANKAKEMNRIIIDYVNRVKECWPKINCFYKRNWAVMD